VWESKNAQPTGTVALRIRFDDSLLAVAVRCTPKSGAVVDVPGIFGWDSTNVDKQNGSFDSDPISVAGTDDAGTQCGIQLPDGPFDFKIDGTTMTLSKTNVTIETFTKVGQ
jgi:hypothetical protein